jgi:hypothetical protein
MSISRFILVIVIMGISVSLVIPVFYIYGMAIFWALNAKGYFFLLVPLFITLLIISVYGLYLIPIKFLPKKD